MDNSRICISITNSNEKIFVPASINREFLHVTGHTLPELLNLKIVSETRDTLVWLVQDLGLKPTPGNAGRLVQKLLEISAKYPVENWRVSYEEDDQQLGTLLESICLLSLVLKNRRGNSIGITKLQKMTYFADKYLGWEIGGFKLHHYGPYSKNVSWTLKVCKAGLVSETGNGSVYELTKEGRNLLKVFICHTDNIARIKHTEKLFRKLVMYDNEQLEILATIDYVQKIKPDLDKEELIAYIMERKEGFSFDTFSKIYDRLLALKNSDRFIFA